MNTQSMNGNTLAVLLPLAAAGPCVSIGGNIMSQSESERIHLALYPIIECLVGDPADTRPAIDEVQNTLAHMLREEQRNLLNKLNDKLFFSTTQPDGQFIKDTIMAEIDAINEDEWERKRAALSTESKGKE